MALNPLRQPWDDPAIRKYLGMPEGSAMPPMPHGMGPMGQRPLAPPMGGRPLAMPGPTPIASTPAGVPRPSITESPEELNAREDFERERAEEERIANLVDDALSSGGGRRVPAIDPSTVKGDYRDPERPPDFQPKAAEPESNPGSDREGLRTLNAFASGMMAGFPGGKNTYDARYWQGLNDRDERLGKEREAKRLLAEQQDPNSQLSRQAQAKWREYLKAAGYSDQEIARMSADDMKGFDLSDISKFAHDAIRKKAEMEAREKARVAALEEQRKYQEGRDEAARTARNEDWKTHNEVTSQQAMDRARVQAGDRAHAVRVQQELDAKKRLDDQTKNYALDLDKAGFPKMKTQIANAEALIKKRLASKGKLYDSPIVVQLLQGPLNDSEIGKAVTASQLSDDDAEMVQALQALINTDVKSDAGSAVSASEDTRKALEQMRLAGANPEGIVKWLNTVKQVLAEREATYAAGYGQDAVNEYKRRRAAATPSTGWLRFKHPETGQTVRVADSPSNRERITKGFGVPFEVVP